jgi:hypothetical protein
MSAALAIRCLACLAVLASSSAVTSQSSLGRISGTIIDEGGLPIARGKIEARNLRNQTSTSTLSNPDGSYSLGFLASGEYSVSVTAPGFSVCRTDLRLHSAQIVVLNSILTIAPAMSEIQVRAPSIFVATLSELTQTTIGSEVLDNIPLPTRNILHLLDLVPGSVSALNNNTTLGRGNKAIAVNGVRANENNYQLNGVDANDITTNGPAYVATPAPESVSEVNVQASSYDAAYGRSPGAQIQVVTKSGSNAFHGSIYGYLRNEALNANVADLKASGVSRPPLRRHVYGGTLGGPLRRGKSSLFVSYQGTREKNGADDSVFHNVLIAPGLTDDRSSQALTSLFGVSEIHPSSLSLLNARLPSGDYLIPTPKQDGRISGYTISTFHEEQFNTNLQFRVSPDDLLSAKFFFAQASGIHGLGAVALPGVPIKEEISNRNLALEYAHTFSPHLLNDFRLGVNYLRAGISAPQSLFDSEHGIFRPTANTYPGLPYITIGPEASIGSPLIDSLGTRPTITIADTVAVEKRNHSLRSGIEVRNYREAFTANAFSRGEIDFFTWESFLTGDVDFAFLGSGIPNRDFRASDYDFFVQETFRVNERFTLNVGLRYELNLPPYETHGRISNFDPDLYVPPPKSIDGYPVGPPGGIVMASNSNSRVPGVTNTNKRMLRSLDPNNLAPRIGLAWALDRHSRLTLRAGYGLYYSREAFDATNITFINAPFYSIGVAFGTRLDNPFPAISSESMLPALFPGTGGFAALDPNLRTPYVQHFDVGFGFQVANEVALKIGYVGSSGVRLYRQLGYNQARLASPERPIINETTQEVITTNTEENAILRAPYQGLSTFPYNNAQFRSDGHSSYNSLQVDLAKTYSRNTQLQLSYTYAKSFDNATSLGAGGNPRIQDVANDNKVAGEQLNGHANRAPSDFDRTHRFVAAGSWLLPLKVSSCFRPLCSMLGDWRISGIVTIQSGIPLDIIDALGGSLYGTAGGHASRSSGSEEAFQNIPRGYYFNPFAFSQALVQPGAVIPSSHGVATAINGGTDLGNVSRNSLRGPGQSNLDLAVGRTWTTHSEKRISFRLEFFNVLNHASLGNPISDLATVNASGGLIDDQGRIVAPGDFGKIVGHTGSPRIGQLALKLEL